MMFMYSNRSSHFNHSKRGILFLLFIYLVQKVIAPAMGQTVVLGKLVVFQ